MSGFSLNHSDIGGYTSVSHPLLGRHRSEELLKRWMELNAFTAIYRTHESNRPEENIQVYSSPEMLEQFEQFARVYRAWGFYRKQLVQEAAATGLPIVRHMFVHYPDDPNVYDISYEQFMVGDEFIVAPVLDPGATRVKAYLPAGRWVHLWTGQVYSNPNAGQTVTVEAPIGQPCVFYREGSMVGAQFVANLRTEGVIY
jgi:alpha-glucosidase